MKKPEAIYCPLCGNATLRHIEECEADEGTRKDAWTCYCEPAERVGLIVYTYAFGAEGGAE